MVRIAHETESIPQRMARNAPVYVGTLTIAVVAYSLFKVLWPTVEHLVAMLGERDALVALLAILAFAVSLFNGLALVWLISQKARGGD
jgi:hypothetical protein